LNNTVRERVIRRGKLKGFCNVSGHATEFIVSSDNLRETLVSRASSSINRTRQLICTLSMAIFGNPHATLAAIAAHINQNHLKVYIAEANSVLSDFLKRKLNPDLFVCSEYFGPPHQSGEIVHGILHEDLQALSFEDETFDVVVTAEVLEHVPDALAAERELMRILKPWGMNSRATDSGPSRWVFSAAIVGRTRSERRKKQAAPLIPLKCLESLRARQISR